MITIPLLFGTVYLITHLDKNFIESFLNFFYILIGKLKADNEISVYEQVLMNTVF